MELLSATAHSMRDQEVAPASTAWREAFMRSSPNEETVGLPAHRSAAVPSLWPWQSEVLAAYAGVDGDAAVELPTGTGKTLVGLLAGEHFRDGGGGPVAFLAGNKQLAQQVERQARELGFPV